MTSATYRKKLIEVALPLEAINREAAREKSIRHGHPSTLHLWWARRPLAACRAVLWASLVDDPSSHPDRFPTEEAQARERERLFRILEALVKWENSNDETVLGAARAEILKSTDGNPPPVLDPFCGGGSIPLEAQRLGLEAHASDLNPVAVLITKALIEIPPKFANRPPVNPDDRGRGLGAQWKGAAGLAADVRYYGKWMRDEAERRIGHLYPKVKLPPERGGGEATVIAWLWARTVTCPNPACGARMPLVRSFWLSTKPGRKAWVEPVVERPAGTVPKVRFEVRTGQGVPADPPKTGRGAKFRCLACQQIADDQHIKDEARAGRMSAQLMAIVVEGARGRVYIAPNAEHESAAHAKPPASAPHEPLPDDPRNIWCVGYGLDTFDKLFTPRQLVALTTFSDLVGEARKRVLRDAEAADLANDGVRLEDGGRGAAAYADAVATYLAFAVDKLTDTNSTLCTWQIDPPRLRATFGRQALPMTWDYAEANPFGDAAGDYQRSIASLCEVLERLQPCARGFVRQEDARDKHDASGELISTDPPYYDNVGYSDLSDYFYIWLRKTLVNIYPALFGTLLTPKSQELIASPYRHNGSAEIAKQFFERGLAKACESMRDAQHREYPMSVFYAFKQSESEDGAGVDSGLVSASTGWETMLEGLLGAQLVVAGTWPMRTELGTRNVGRGTNALASSIVLVCRPRPADAPPATRREFVAALKRELPRALKDLQRGSIAPVDLAQAAIGPGMAVYSRYTRVLEPDGSSLRVRAALQLINQALDEVLAEQEGEYDEATRWAVKWFEQFGAGEGPFGQANVLAQATNTAVNALVDTGIVAARGGRVRLLGRADLPGDWGLAADRRLTAWEVAQHLIRALDERGEEGAARLLARVGGELAEVARDLAYRLYTTAERKGWAQEALAYNGLVVAWPEIDRLASSLDAGPRQERLLG